MRMKSKAMASIILLLVAAATLPAIAKANTDGSELQATDQPDRLILKLGPQWAGTEFELKTDAGVFPAPVVVDSVGILRMDLGGSRTYTLSCITPIAPAPAMQPALEPTAAAPEPSPEVDDSPEPQPVKGSGVPALQLVVFLIGLVIAAGGLAAIRYFKRRRDAYYYDDNEEDYD